MDLQSKEVGELVAALASARVEFEPIAKEENADLSDVLKSVIPALSKYGLVQSQTTINESEPLLVTTLYHKSGQWLRGYFPIDHHDILGNLKKARNIGLCAILGISAGKAENVAVNVPLQTENESPKKDSKRYGEQSPGVFKRPRPDLHAPSNDGKKTLKEIREKVAKDCPDITPETVLAGGDFAVSKEEWIGLKLKDAHEWQEAGLKLLHETGISRMNTIDQRFAFLAHDLRNERRRQEEIDRQRYEERRGQSGAIKEQTAG